MKYERTEADQQLIERAWAIVRRRPEPVLDAGRWLNRYTPTRCRRRQERDTRERREALVRGLTDSAKRREIQDAFPHEELKSWDLKHDRLKLAWGHTFIEDIEDERTTALWDDLPRRDKLELAGRMVLLLALTRPDADDLLDITKFHKDWPWKLKDCGEAPDFDAAEGDNFAHRCWTGKCLATFDGWGTRPLWLDKLECAVLLLESVCPIEPAPQSIVESHQTRSQPMVPDHTAIPPVAADESERRILQVMATDSTRRWSITGVDGIVTAMTTRQSLKLGEKTVRRLMPILVSRRAVFREGAKYTILPAGIEASKPPLEDTSPARRKALPFRSASAGN